jgi:hypothetical protein
MGIGVLLSKKKFPDDTPNGHEVGLHVLAKTLRMKVSLHNHPNVSAWELDDFDIEFLGLLTCFQAQFDLQFLCFDQRQERPVDYHVVES